MRAGAANLRGAVAPLYPRADRIGAEDDGPGRPAHHDRRPAAVADGPAGGLPLCLALRPCRAALPGRLSRHGPGRPRAHRRLLEGDTGMSAPLPLLRVERVRQHFALTKGIVFTRTLGHIKAVDDVSFDIQAGKTLGLVGESGCGKTTTSRMILNLETPTDGRILLDRQPIHALQGPAPRPCRATLQASLPAP